MKEWDRENRKKKLADGSFDLQIKHILPKANQIVKTSQQNIRSIYPFVLQPPLPSKAINIPFLGYSYEGLASSNRTKFIPERQSVAQHFEPRFIIYDKFNTNSSFSLNIYSIDKLKSLSKNDFVTSVNHTLPISSPTALLDFDSRFQCGNLSAVSYINEIYSLLLQNDVNTSGYTNWFYFSVTPRASCKGKMAIMNYGKAGWALNHHPGICCFVVGQNIWKRFEGNVQCNSNSNLYSKNQNSEYQNFNTLYFQYDFIEGEQVYFAYNPPYSYTNLLQLLDSIEERKLTYFHRKLVGTSLVGNRLEMITITNFEKMRHGIDAQPVIVMLARTHAGETVSSWIMHFIIVFLISDDLQAQNLRDNFVFKIFPMVNPDGVVHGNYRCSLIGRDLNRRWKNPSKEYYPEIYFIKNHIIDTLDKRPIKMVLDFHGHTQKRKSFFYGCIDKNIPHKPRLFPYLASKLSQHFEFSYCNFAMEKSKQSTARITLYHLIKSPEIFTLQTSQFGMAEKFLSTEAFQQISLTICKTIYRYYKLKSVSLNSQPTLQNNLKDQLDEYEEEVLSNPYLMKVGCDPSDGSDSQPSVCNINFEKINKMAINMQKRPQSENVSRKKVDIRSQSYKQPDDKLIKRKQLFSSQKSRNLNDRPEREFSPSGLRGSTAITQRRQSEKIKLRTPKLEYTKEQQKTKQFSGDVQKKPLRMINFELLIDQSVRRKSSLRQQYFQSLDIKFNHSNYHMIQKRCMFRNRSYNWNKNSV